MKTTLGVLVATLLVSAPAYAKHWHDDDDHWKKHAKHHDRDDDDDRDFDHRHESCYFQPHDVEVISRYYAPRYRSLPPGLEKKYYRTGHLPPGWEKRMEPVPVVVERELVPVPPEYRRGIIDGNVVLYSPRTQVVIDVVALFGPR
jgi:Ni/Co efflux regulator RcnB